MPKQKCFVLRSSQAAFLSKNDQNNFYIVGSNAIAHCMSGLDELWLESER